MQKALSLTLACLLWYQVHGQSEGDLRLNRIGLTGGSSGRLEIYHNSQWGTVCNESFGSTEADVACRQLGYSSASSYGNVESFRISQLEESSTPIWLDNVNCSGSESRLTSCSHNGYGNENCSHSQDVTLFCSRSITSSSDGDLRLNYLGQTRNSFGRLEIYHNSQWGTVCDNFFGYMEAYVACRQLGYSNPISYSRVGRLRFTQASSSTPIWLDGVNCFSSESRLASCRHRGYGNENCSHSQDIGLRCSIRTTFGPGQSRSNGDLRLFGRGTKPANSGRLEIYYILRWGTVCADSFGSTEADVACRQLGYSSASNYGSVGTLGFSQAFSSTPIWLVNISCSGSETKLASCNHTGYGHTDSCDHSDDIALRCSNVVTSTPELDADSTTGAIIAGIVGGVVLLTLIVVVCIVISVCCVAGAKSCTYRNVRAVNPPNSNPYTHPPTDPNTGYPPN